MGKPTLLTLFLKLENLYSSATNLHSILYQLRKGKQATVAKKQTTATTAKQKINK